MVICIFNTVAAIVVTVAVPSGRNASVVVRTAEAVARARPLRTGGVILVRVISAIIVAVTQPKRFDANVGRVALEMARRAGGIASAPFTSLVCCVGVLTIVDTVTDLRNKKYDYYLNFLNH